MSEDSSESRSYNWKVVRDDFTSIPMAFCSDSLDK
eukprot:CAMPEP_0173172502 /NCGR_PEP_ID=MMETSP1141-20130122/2343_1 /TAXON_ID=483371 /ORGANISM="non described non described, Strain CCMP2298" /LENGTH=34 /DNA_ID= /DNA_START= /DNA_END= /DNA_ORIENTATION=